MKIALVHDWLVNLGGAERVLIALHKIFPEAPVYTIFYDKKFVSRHLSGAKLTSSFLQKIPRIAKFHPWFKILMSSAVESLDLNGFDLVISSSNEFGHGIILKPGIKHISYYHSPSRLLWDRSHDWIKDFKKRNGSASKITLIKAGQHFLRLWDYTAGQRPDVMIANSKHVAERIKKYYGREAKVIYPPVEVNSKFEILNPKQIQNYFLIVSRLYPHKKIDLAVEAFKKTPSLNLLVIGQGPERKNLLKIAGGSKNIKFFGFKSDRELVDYYRNCVGYIICNEEDFGISPVEAMFFGKPVLAYESGGARETVLDGITGKFFNKQDPEYLAKAVESFSKEISAGRYNSEKIIKHAEKFSLERFKREILDITDKLDYNNSL